MFWTFLIDDRHSSWRNIYLVHFIENFSRRNLAIIMRYSSFHFWWDRLITLNFFVMQQSWTTSWQWRLEPTTMNFQTTQKTGLWLWRAEITRCGKQHKWLLTVDPEKRIPSNIKDQVGGKGWINKEFPEVYKRIIEAGKGMNRGKLYSNGSCCCIKVFPFLPDIGWSHAIGL